MRRLNRKTVIFLVVLGAVVYSIRGAGAPEATWRAVAVLYAIIGVMVAARFIWDRVKRTTEHDGFGIGRTADEDGPDADESRRDGR